MAPRLSPGQLRVYRFLVGEIARRGMPPSHREIMAEFGYRSTNAANDYLRALERKGYIRREHGDNRAIKVLLDADGHPIGSRLVPAPTSLPTLLTTAKGTRLQLVAVAVRGADRLLDVAPMAAADAVEMAGGVV